MPKATKSPKARKVLKVRKAVVPVAGLGTRFLPASKAIPKEMLTIVDRPTIQYIVEEAVESGIEEVILVTSEGKSAIENHFDYSFELETVLEKKNKFKLLEELKHTSKLIDIVSVRQKKPLGLGHAIWSARNVVGDEPFAVLLGDDLVLNKKPCLKQMLSIFKKEQGSIVAIQHVPLDQKHNYGIVEGTLKSKRVYKINRMIEKPERGETDSDMAIIGRYILMPEIFKLLGQTEAGHGDEIQLTDALRKLSRKQAMYAYEFVGERFDAGDKLGYLKAIIAYGIRHSVLSKDFKKYIKEVASTL